MSFKLTPKKQKKNRKVFLLVVTRNFGLALLSREHQTLSGIFICLSFCAFATHVQGACLFLSVRVLNIFFLYFLLDRAALKLKQCGKEKREVKETFGMLLCGITFKLEQFQLRYFLNKIVFKVAISL